MFKYVFYAMEPAAMERYAAFKDMVSAEQINLSNEEIQRITAQIQDSRADSRELFTVDADGNAHITVAGPLEPKPDPCAIMFDVDMTTYGEIIQGTQEAEADPRVKGLIYDIDSPGGNLVGLFKTVGIVRDTKKPTLAINHGLCASAALAIASQCDEIVAENISNETGSIGVVTERIDKSGLDKGKGVTRYIITSQNAENKVPDVTTEEGRDKIKTRMNGLESVFIEYVALGRHTTIEDVKTNFGRGGVLLARDARAVKMIDRIESEINPEGIPLSTPAGQKATASENQTEGANSMGDITMTEEQLNALVTDTANKAVTGAQQSFQATLDERDNKAKAEAARLAGFDKLRGKFPEMSAMIDDEAKKEGAIADVDFLLKVSSADTARLSELEKQQGAAGDQAAGAGAQDGGETDNSGNILAGALGLEIKGAK